MEGWEELHTAAAVLTDNQSRHTALPMAVQPCEDLNHYMVLKHSEQVAIGSICFLAGPITLLENLLVLGVIAASAPLRRRPSYLFIASLALADIFASCFFTINFLDFHLFKRCDSPAAYLFKLGGVTLAFSGSVGSLLLTALDRYVCIHHAARYHTLLTCRRALLALLGLWSLVLLISFLPLMGWRCPSDLRPRCSGLFPYIHPRYVLCWASFILALLVLILGAYGLVLWRAHQHEASMSGLQGAPAGQSRMRMDIRLARTLGLILLIMVGCWLPVLAFMLADVRSPLIRPQQRAFAFCSTLCLVNSAVNPLLYALRCRELRGALLRLAGRLWGPGGPGGCQRPMGSGDSAPALPTAESNCCSMALEEDGAEGNTCRVDSVSGRVNKQLHTSG
ncbi:cannabinoid receptor 2 [Osmerus eperlanus]|uniref:cannabinoid receptor 2 n=1 Tax=Osmerus eperlanus TaxID=29151 RepID=UPI002E1305FF